MELKTSRGASLQSRGVSHSQVPAASVVPHAHAATDDKDNLCSTSSLGFARGGNQLAGSILALCSFSFTLPADGVGLAVPLSVGLASSCILPPSCSG